MLDPLDSDFLLRRLEEQRDTLRYHPEDEPTPSPKAATPTKKPPTPTTRNASEQGAQEAPMTTTSTSAKKWIPLGAAGSTVLTDSNTSAVPAALDPSGILSVLTNVGIPAQQIVGAPAVGPSVTTYAIQLAPGATVSTIHRRVVDIAFGLGLPAVRILTHLISHQGCIGLEVPNTVQGTVSFRSLVPSLMASSVQGGALPVALGVHTDCRPEVTYLDLAPHLLIAGRSGSGKSAAINAVLGSLALRTSPSDVAVFILDPKQMDYQKWVGLPHLVSSPIVDPEAIAKTLEFVDGEMERRNRKFREYMVTSLNDYNKSVDAGHRLPRYVLVIDEYGDLMLKTGSAGKTLSQEISTRIRRLATLGRAAGLHLVLATQRPTADTVDGTIKAQTLKLACTVETALDSRIILDDVGAEKLQGAGDALFKNFYGLQRLKCPWVSDADVRALVQGG
jgi:S-DNA-T family DNA segregation ATPase FtsK/SpoIIIE